MTRVEVAMGILSKLFGRPGVQMLYWPRTRSPREFALPINLLRRQQQQLAGTLAGVALALRAAARQRVLDL